MSALSREALWSRLREAALVEGEPPARGDAHAPWYVRVMLGIAGWIGALFLLGFVGAGFAFVLHSPGAAFLAGAGACALSVSIFRAAPKNDFVAQFGLATSLAGQMMMGYAAGQWFGRSPIGIALFLMLQQALLFVLVPNYVHRLWSAWSSAIAASYAMLDAGLAGFAAAGLTAAFVWTAVSWFRLARHGATLRAGILGLALASVQMTILYGTLFGGFVYGSAGHGLSLGVAGLWMGRFASLAVLVWAVVLLLRREGLGLASPQARVGLAGALILGIASLKAPGVGPAVAVLIVGFANADRVLGGLGVLALLGYLAHYYYALQATLLEKSGLLLAAGIALLALRHAMRRWWPEPQEVRHA